MPESSTEKQYTEAEALAALRDKVQEILDQGYDEGILSSGVYEQKKRQAENAAAPEDLESIVASLPDQKAQREESRALTISPGHKSYFTIMADNRYNSPELLRDRLDTLTIMGETTLDFTQLNWDGLIEVQVTAVMASVKIKVPADAKVDFGVTAIMAESRDRRNNFGDSPSKLLNIRGIAVMAEVRVVS